MNIAFTTTAMNRPEIFKRTVESFRKNLLGIDWGNTPLYINIDPVPAPVILTKEWVDACDFFGFIDPNSPIAPSFPAAVKWCWSQPETEFFIHLEDDWELLRPIHIDELISFLQGSPLLSCVNLRAYNFPPGDDRICLSPCLMRTSHAKVLAKRLCLEANPEKQLRDMTPQNIHGGKHEGFYSMQYPDKPVLRDIGREWLASSGWRKTDPMYFTKWERVP